MQNAALLVFLAFIFWLFAREMKRRQGVSNALWIVFAWLVIISSRAVSTWLEVGREAGASAIDYDQGNPLERNVYFLLLLSGLITLFRRGVRLEQILRSNPWLCIFAIYWLFSVLWADLPFVAFKRWIKDTGNLVMVFVILTEKDPLEAARAVFVRSACLLIPLSILFIRYYSELGRAYHPPTGEMMFTGVATHKNTLGALVMVAALFLTWDLLGRRTMGSRRRRGNESVHPVGQTQLHQRLVTSSPTIKSIPELVLLAMTLWLVLKSGSATSLACAAIGLAILFGLKSPSVRSRLNRIEVYALAGGVVYWLLNSMFDTTRLLVEGVLGRDMTLTTRTEVWPVLLSQADSPIVGSGFMSFWSGDRLAKLLDDYGIIQAHNGYLEVYLNGGWVAVILLIVLLVSSSRMIKLDLLRKDEFATMRFILLVVAVIHNFTEATISKGGLIWFVLLLSIARYPKAMVDVRACCPKPRRGGMFIELGSGGCASSVRSGICLRRRVRRAHAAPNGACDPARNGFL